MNLVDIRRGDLPRFPDGRVVLKCPTCRLIRTKPRATPCDVCGGEMKPTIVFNHLEPRPGKAL